MPKILALPESQIIHQDGALPHRAVDVKRYLDIKLLQCSIARQGPIASPEKSPDLTPLNFSL